MMNTVMNANLNHCSIATSLLIQKRHALYAGDLEAFAAADVLAHHHVIAAQHVGLRLGKLCAIPFVRPRR